MLSGISQLSDCTMNESPDPENAAPANHESDASIRSGKDVFSVLIVEDDADIDFLRSAFDFEIVSQQEDGYVIVAASALSSSRLAEVIEKFLADERGGGRAAKHYDMIQDLTLEQR